MAIDVSVFRLEQFHSELPGLGLLLRLLPPQRHLRGHHPLPLRDQRALGAHAVLPATVALVSLQRGHHAVVPAARALRGARVLLRGPVQQRLLGGQPLLLRGILLLLPGPPPVLPGGLLPLLLNNVSYLRFQLKKYQINIQHFLVGLEIPNFRIFSKLNHQQLSHETNSHFLSASLKTKQKKAATTNNQKCC